MTPGAGSLITAVSCDLHFLVLRCDVGTFCTEQFACQTAGAALLGNDEDLLENRPCDLIEEGREITTYRQRLTRNRRPLDLDPMNAEFLRRANRLRAVRQAYPI
jgi:hypothetical protein